jgi:hypothetical protein
MISSTLHQLDTKCHEVGTASSVSLEQGDEEFNLLGIYRIHKFTNFRTETAG